MSYKQEARFYAKEILAPECDELCRWRTCYQPGFNKGTFNVGQGYRSYFEKPSHVCLTRMQRGCPSDPITQQRPMPNTEVMLKDLSLNKKYSKHKIIHIMKLMVHCQTPYQERGGACE